MNSFITLIDPDLLKINYEQAILDLWKNFYDKLKNLDLGKNLKIYSHNLGSFDGYFISQSLYNYCHNPKNITTLIDNRNNFISISFKYSQVSDFSITEESLAEANIFEENMVGAKDYYNWTFLDSYRLFPVSLNELCKIFDVEGKKSIYNSNWNEIKIFDNQVELDQFIEYSLQDSTSLLLAMNKARNLYWNSYNVDIVKSVSTPSLSLNIYRHKFQPVDIPILKRNLDKKIRPSYFGGSSDYFKFYGTHLKFYDINSSYSDSMKKDMPLIFLGEFSGNFFKLDDIFGFVECIVEAPDNIEVPLLIARHNGKIIHPIGKWTGTYFSEEIKEVIKHGYKVKITKVYQFSRGKLFEDYVNHFYEKKV